MARQPTPSALLRRFAAGAPAPSFPGRVFSALSLSLSAWLSGCAAWQPQAHYAGWTLYVRDGESLDAAPFQDAFEPAFELVQRELGPFERDVRVHAWLGGVELASGNKGEIREGIEPVTSVPGLGPARVRAFHARGGSHPFDSGGVFIGEADAGTAVHELVHARISELSLRPPLWFEEGLASLFSDGALYGGRWVIDGFSFWPWKELRAQTLAAEELASLLALESGDEHTVKQNLLVHFVGWALVFDLARAEPAGNWRDWLARARRMDALEARERLERTLASTTPIQWLEHLNDGDPGVRLAAARGAWKLANAECGERLYAALVKESDPEVKVALAVNLLLGPGQSRSGGQSWQRMRRDVLPLLREAQLPDAAESKAAHDLYRAWRGRVSRQESQEAMNGLRRFWEE